MEEEKEGKGKKYFAVLIAFIFLFLIAAVVAFVMYFTNNLSTDLTTFYVQYGAQEIRRDTGRMQFEKGVYYTFRCEYPLGFPSNERGDRYIVSVEATEAGKEIEYLVDGSNTRFYPKSPDVTQSFEISKKKDSFTFRITEETTLKSILTKAYEGKEIKNIPVVDLTAKDYVSLVVKSYDGGTVIRIGFGFDGKFDSEASEAGSPSKEEEGNDPVKPPEQSENPEPVFYKISSYVQSSPTDPDLVSPKITLTKTEALPGERVEVYLYPRDNWDLSTGGVTLNKIGANLYEFIMPEKDVTIMYLFNFSGTGGNSSTNPTDPPPIIKF